MRKQLVFQVNIKPDKPKEDKGQRFTYMEDIYTLSNKRVKSWAESMGADYILITDDRYLKDIHPAWQRIIIFDKSFNKDYDDILYLDSDLIRF